MRFAVEFHRNGKLTKGINSTFIAHIPIVDNPQSLNDFRPISLAEMDKGMCNDDYNFYSCQW